MRKNRVLIEILIIGLMVVVFLHGESESKHWLKVTVITQTPNDDLGPAWSPDGQRIAFVAHHDGNPEVYLLELSSGELTNLSNSPRDDYDPRWSPDGQYIVFRRREDSGKWVVVETATGTSVELPDSYGDFSGWSADSRQLILITHNSNSTCSAIYDVFSRQYRQTACFTGDRFLFSVSPDSKYWIIRDRSMSTWELFDAGTGETRPLTLVESVSGNIIWSPDSRFIVYAARREPETVSINVCEVFTGTTTEVYKVTTPNTIWYTLSGWSLDGELAWSIVYPSNTPNPGNRTEFYVMEPLGNAPPDVRQVGSINHIALDTEWSPAGQFLGFRTYAGIYVLDIRTSTLYNLIYGRSYILDFHWSPDGRFITAYLSGTPDAHPEAAVAELRTGRVALIDRMWGRGSSWLPDGKWLVATCGDYSKTNLCLIEFPDQP